MSNKRLKLFFRLDFDGGTGQGFPVKLCYITDFTARLPLGYGFHFGEFAGGMALLAVGVWGLSVLRKWLGPDGVEIAWWIVAAFFVLLAILF